MSQLKKWGYNLFSLEEIPTKCTMKRDKLRLVIIYPQLFKFEI